MRNRIKRKNTIIRSGYKKACRKCPAGAFVSSENNRQRERRNRRKSLWGNVSLLRVHEAAISVIAASIVQYGPVQEGIYIVFLKECNVMRVIAGEHKGRALKAVPNQLTRPTTDKVKESLFSVLGPFLMEGNALICLQGAADWASRH